MLKKPYSMKHKKNMQIQKYKHMSNTYFQIKKEDIFTDNRDHLEYINKMSLTLTAFVGKTPNSLQLTVQIKSTLPNQSGIGYITLSQEEQDKLIIGILERRNNISATGEEQSNICPSID